MDLQPIAPEQKARERIDAQLEQAGWLVQSYPHFNIHAGRGVAIREFPTANGPADYVLYVDAQPVGVLEAKPEGHTLTGVEGQALEYAEGFPGNLGAPVHPLPFLYLSTGQETLFCNLLDPQPRSRGIFSFHRPATLAEWLAADTLDAHVRSLHLEGSGFYTAADDTKPSTFRSRLRTLPPVHIPNLWQNKVEALNRLEESLRDDRPRALIQMATGSGKTLLAITAIYRLIKFGGARRVLFLVDRSNRGEQAEKEFGGYRTPDDHRKFTDLYGVQHLTTNTIGASSKVVITTIQRLYSMLKGEPEFDPALEDESAFETDSAARKEPLPVVYNPTYPPETFDLIVVDECHRSIYTLWRQVLEYFDAYLVGLTATPAAHTYGFFYAVPYHQRLTRKDIKALAEAIHEPPRAWTPDVLWRAYELLRKDQVRGASGQRLLTDILSLVRFALHRDDELVPYAERVRERYASWRAQQENAGRRFDDEQRWWLDRMAEHVAKNAEVVLDDFDLAPFVQRGGLGRAAKVFGGGLPELPRELNEALVA